jgi:hypothetical protein
MIVMRFANGEHAIEAEPQKPYRVEASEMILNEDWKTAAAHSQRSIQRGERGKLMEIVDNHYGRFARVEFEQVGSIYTDPKKLTLMLD